MSKHRRQTRSERLAARRRAQMRQRIVMLGAAVGMSLMIGVAAVFVAPQLRAQTADASAPGSDETKASPTPTKTPAAKATPSATPTPPPPPEGSGQGRRIVFDEGDQRVWLIGDDNRVARTYLVSGSKYDNLDPGSYRVQQRHRNATAFDYTGTMEYFVQFTVGQNAPIGFHSVPVDNNGKLEQTKAHLGTALSSGCIRQWKNDAEALWNFGSVGTPVYVTA